MTFWLNGGNGIGAQLIKYLIYEIVKIKELFHLGDTCHYLNLVLCYTIRFMDFPSSNIRAKVLGCFLLEI